MYGCVIQKRSQPRLRMHSWKGSGMADASIPYRSFPAPLRYCLYCLSGGWAAITYFAYLIAISPKTIGLLVVLGVVGCFSLIKVKEWGRRFTIAGNTVIIVSFVLFAAVLRHTRGDLSLLALSIAAVFSLATYYLITRETSDFFKTANAVRHTGTTV